MKLLKLILISAATFQLSSPAFSQELVSRTSSTNGLDFAEDNRIDEAKIKIDNTTVTSIIARVETTGGHRFEFVDEGEAVGIAEIAPSGSQSNLGKLVENYDASPLEIFKAIVPADQIVPHRLVQDHDRFVDFKGRNDFEPLDLELRIKPSVSHSVDEGYDPSFCSYNETWTPGFSQFTNWWYYSVGSTKDFTAQQTFQHEDLNGTEGKFWDAGNSNERWLGACNGNNIFGFPAFRFRAQYLNNLGNWNTAYTTQLEPYHWIKYYSFSSPQRWGVLLQEMTYNVFLDRVYAVGVAGNEPFDFSIKIATSIARWSQALDKFIYGPNIGDASLFWKTEASPYISLAIAKGEKFTMNLLRRKS